MNIVLHVLGMPFNGETILTKSLGGSESAGYYLALELAKRGHKVSVFTSSTEEGEFDGVTYCYAGNQSGPTPLGDRFEFYAQNTPHDVLIIQRHPYAFHKKWAAKLCIHQMHDLALHRYNSCIHNGLSNTDVITVVSDWHKKQLLEIYGVKESNVFVVPNGVDGSNYESIEPKPKSTTFDMLYQSRPERGLEHLVRPGGIMEKLHESYPGKYVLYYCSYDNTTEQMASYYAQLNEWAKRLPNVSNLGSMKKRDLAEVQVSCDLLCYPTEFEEVSCITAMESMHAGLPMLTSAVGALPETCKEAGIILHDLVDGRANEEAFIASIKHLSDNRDELKLLADKQREAAKVMTWTTSTDKLEEVIFSSLKEKSANPASVIRTAIERADIQFAYYVRETYPELADDRIGAAALEELDEMYAFAESDEAYAAHYAKHQGEYYDGPGANVVGEDVTSTSRFRAVISMVEEARHKYGAGMHVVDYGCAHGHFVIPLAKAFPDCVFTGVDISDRAIGKALEWVTKEGIGNVNLVVGTSNDLSKVKEAQVIIACEVLEHVPEMQKVVDKLRAKLVDGGTLIATTPYGRWEWIGTEAFKNGREHLHHFDRKDIDEVFEDFSHKFICAPAGQDQGSEPIGSFVWSFVEDKKCDLRSINFERKYNEYAPRQTLSVCMIVSNAMKTIEACLDSMVDAADEFVIMIDPKTKDGTEKFLYEYSNKHPFKSFFIDNGVDALKEGFDAARNLSIYRASGDWILWCDADEIVHNKWALHKLLRTSCNDGYAMAQIHYAIDPAQVLTTDMPCRLFRNNIGVQFYGVVHEHPETEIGKAVPHTMLCGDVKFLHNGYIDEPTRRARFNRNLPLLHRDFEKHPNRYLTKFLMLRDLSQGLSFEIETSRGMRPADYASRTNMAIKLFEELIEEAPLRLVIDAVGFYSNCVEIMQAGFTAELNIVAAKDVAPDLAVNTSVKGRFLSTKHYLTLVDKLAKEAVKHYESKHL